MNARLSFTQVPLGAASHLFIDCKEKKDRHKPRLIVPLFRDPVTGDPLYFAYCQKKFFYNKDKKIFSKSEYPISEIFRFYSKSDGLSSQETKEALERWSDNSMDLPIPTFVDLMKEHIVAPFFIFQLFCVFLWMLDEYVQLTIYILVMLFVFESSIAYQRLANWQRIKRLRRPHKPIKIYRDKQWVELSSSKLLPGDIVKIERSEKEVIIPCDLLIIKGKCQVDESILTGESIPQLKEDVSGRDLQEQLEMSRDKVHLLMGGTKIVQQPNMLTCYVLRTGWDTTQGKLMRTILFSSERLTVGNKEAFMFILLLLVFAILATGYVLYHTINDPDRDPYKLVIKCTIILTAVVPPELPIELALAVNASIAALMKKNIFCTEPFRLPQSGKVTACCFDKTGTLTDQDFELKGWSSPSQHLAQAKNLGRIDGNSKAAMVVAGCNSLGTLKGELVGDPLEKVMLNALGGQVSEETVHYSGKAVSILKRFPFNSEVKRMSCVIKKENNKWLVCKGAPEALERIMTDTPGYFKELIGNFTGQGFRVIAMAYKEIDNANGTREELEQGLSYAGVVVLSSPLKPNTLRIMEELENADFQNVMITGDNVHTAGQVAIDLKFGQELLFVNKNFQVVDSAEEVQEIKRDSVLCVTGELMPEILEHPLFQSIKVFARVTPKHKEMIVNQINKTQFTLMCGDGTNDVGALKKAHAGIALLNKPIKTQTKSTEMSEMPELGDASVAAPFTSKLSNISAVKTLIQHGRCTLVTTFQMYKILALNCLLSAYGLSVQYLQGVKYGDSQATISGIFLSIQFFCVSRSQPSEKLSKFKPPTSVFEFQIMASIFGQFAVHLAGLMFMWYISVPYVVDAEDFVPDAPFKPNLLNSCVFLFSCWVNSVNFLVNYEGEPFMKAMKENRGLTYALTIFFLLIMGGVFQAEPVMEMLELVPFPNEMFSYMVAAVLLADMVICCVIQLGCNYYKYGLLTIS